MHAQWDVREAIVHFKVPIFTAQFIHQSVRPSPSMFPKSTTQYINFLSEMLISSLTTPRYMNSLTVTAHSNITQLSNK